MKFIYVVLDNLYLNIFEKAACGRRGLLFLVRQEK
jgi:hypothetical protein